MINKPVVNTFFKEFTDNRKNKNIGNRIISIIEKSTNIYESSGLQFSQNHHWNAIKTINTLEKSRAVMTYLIILGISSRRKSCQKAIKLAIRVFSTGEDGGRGESPSPTDQKFTHPFPNRKSPSQYTPPHEIFFPLNNNFHVVTQ